MVANKSKHRRKTASWGVTQWLILGLVAVFFAASSGCATRPPRTVPRAEPPQLVINENLRTGVLCDGLRGRLPTVEELTVGAALDGWEGAEAFGACQQNRADEIVRASDDFNAAWRRYVDGLR